jgi:hypothetical protein
MPTYRKKILMNTSKELERFFFVIPVTDQLDSDEG